MILIINTANTEQATVALIINNKILKQRNFKAQFKQAEKLLSEIDKLITGQKLTINKIKGIIVVSGPGSFTALRIGVVVANTLTWALKIPIAGAKVNRFKDLKDLALKSELILSKAKKDSFLLPFYGKEPNITKSK